MGAARVAVAPPFGGGGTGVASPGSAALVSRWSLAPWLILSPYDAWTVPYWALAAGTGVVPAMWLCVGVRRLYRRRRGMCARCGYDLRASTDRCPECGTAIKRKGDQREESH
jgi:hypothetical protein